MSAATGRDDDTVIEVRGVHTRLGGAVVHEDVSLTVRRGEIFALHYRFIPGKLEYLSA